MKVAVEAKIAYEELGSGISARIGSSYSSFSVVTQSIFDPCTKLHGKTDVSDVEYDEELGPPYVDKLCKEQRLEDAVQVVTLLQRRGHTITRDHIYSLLQACMKENDLETCRRIHRLMVGSGLDGIVVLVDHLIRLFTSSKSLDDASRVFNRLTRPTIHTWNALLTAHTKLGEGQRALNLFHMMEGWGIKPDKVTFLCVLKACSNSRDLKRGRDVHKQILDSVYASDTMLGNAIIDMYAKCNNLEKALEVFKELSSRDVVSWGAMIMGYVQNGQALPALKLFEQILHQGVQPSKVVFLGIFKASGILSSGIWGRLIHNVLIQTEITIDLAISNSLIDMYTKCGLMTDAQSCFNSLPVQDEVSWGTMISGFVALGYSELALKYLDQMQQQGLKLNSIVFSCLVKACGLMKDIMQGMRLHDLIIETGTAVDMVVYSSLVDMYMKCEALQEARNVFNAIPLKDLVSWGSVIAGYCALGHGFAALELFGQMQEYGTNPDKMIVITLVKACGDIASLHAIMLMQHYITEAEMDADGNIGSAFIDIYAKCGCLREANVILDGLHSRDHVSWCSMIAGYATQGHGALALELFERMQCEGFETNRVVVLCTLQACGSTGSLYQSRIIHDKIVRSNFELDTAVANTLIDVYSKCGSLETACKVFETLGTLDDVHWGTMLAGYVMHGKNLEALELLLKLQDEGVEVNTFMCSSILKAFSSLKEGGQGRYIHNDILCSSLETDTVVANSLILMYSRQGHLEDAYWVLKNLQKRDAVSWATIIAANTEDGRGLLAMRDFEGMQNEGVHPGMGALVCTVKACASIGALPHGRFIHNLIVLGEIEKDAVIGSTLVELYSRSGSMDEAWQVFSKLPHQDAAAWGALIAGCAHHGKTELARYFFSDMLRKGVKPDSGVFTGLLATCSQGGLVQDGHQYFISMSKDFNVSPNVQHYGCIIDLFGRAGCFDQAKDFIDMMPVYPDMVIWMSLLTNCRTYTNVRMANRCFEQLLKLEAVDAACYILMASIHSEANLWQNAEQVWELRGSVDVREQLDIAWLKVDEDVHEFVVGGEHDPRREDAHIKIGKLMTLLRSKGFVPSLNLVLEPFLSETEPAMRVGLQDCSKTGEEIKDWLMRTLKP